MSIGNEANAGKDPMIDAKLTPAPSFRLDGKTALITGASKNIGFAIAVAFAQAGADLLLIARGERQLAEAAERIHRGTGSRVDTVAADVSTVDGFDKVVAQASTLPPVDILVNNAHTVGSSPDTSLFEVHESVWEEVLSTNLLGPFRLCSEFGRRMLDGTGGSIINIVSGSGLLPAARLGPYGASKAALWMMTRYLAIEGAPSVRVNAICPGLVSEDGQPRNESHRAIIKDVPMGRVATPDEVAGAALYLASPAASYTTGEMLIVNGGRAW